MRVHCEVSIVLRQMVWVNIFYRFEECVVVRRGYPRLAKGAGLKIRQSLVRDPVAQAFVGSSPTPRTTLEPPSIFAS